MIALLRMSTGLIGWAIAFSLVYALHGIGCSWGWEAVPVLGTSVHRLLLIGAWLASVAATLTLALRWRRPGHDLSARAASVLAWTGAAATIVGGLPILILPACL